MCVNTWLTSISTRSWNKRQSILRLMSNGLAIYGYSKFLVYTQCGTKAKPNGSCSATEYHNTNCSNHNYLLQIEVDDELQLLCIFVIKSITIVCFVLHTALLGPRVQFIKSIAIPFHLPDWKSEKKLINFIFCNFPMLYMNCLVGGKKTMCAAYECIKSPFESLRCLKFASVAHGSELYSDETSKTSYK